MFMMGSVDFMPALPSFLLKANYEELTHYQIQLHQP